MDAYTKHLTNIRDTNTVVATADICNAQGQLLVPIGAKIDEAATNRIVNVELLKPIEECVAIENDLGAKRLKIKIMEYVFADPFLAEINMLNDVSRLLQGCCEAYEHYPLLRQKMTVMSIVLKRTFQNALFSSWFSVLLSSKYRPDEQYAHCAFIAALTHDIGLMHITPDILLKEKKLTTHEIKQIHTHPIIGYRILSGVSSLPDAIAVGVKEHHENIDGTGFPAGKMGKTFNEFGRLIHLLDNAFGVYEKHVKPLERSVVDVIPVMTMNYHTRANPFFIAFVNLLRTCGVPAERIISDEMAAPIIKKTLQGHKFVHRFLESKKDIIGKFGHKHGNARLFTIQNAYLHIYSLMSESGLINEPYMRWLEMVQEQCLSHAYNEVEEAYLMLCEIIFQVQRIKQFARVFFEDPKNAALLEKSPKIMDQINVNDVPYF